jgi:hypothetical protein
MSLAAQIAASRKAAQKEADAEAQKEAFKNQYIAKTMMKSKKKGEPPFPTNQIESLKDIAIQVVAANYTLYTELDGVTDEKVKEEIVKRTSRKL